MRIVCSIDLEMRPYDLTKPIHLWRLSLFLEAREMKWDISGRTKICAYVGVKYHVKYQSLQLRRLPHEENTQSQCQNNSTYSILASVRSHATGETITDQYETQPRVEIGHRSKDETESTSWPAWSSQSTNEHDWCACHKHLFGAWKCPFGVTLTRLSRHLQPPSHFDWLTGLTDLLISLPTPKVAGHAH